MPSSGPANAPWTLAGGFHPTRWSVVLAAADRGAPEGSLALAELCRAYWRPLYGFVRRQGFAPHDAEDLTQDFFARLLAKETLASVNSSKGRFRSFLLASLKNFLNNERDRARAQKRGGDAAMISMNTETAEVHLHPELADDRSPDRLFDRQWAILLLERVLQTLQASYEAAGKGDLFATLKPLLAGAEGVAKPYAELAQTLGLSEGAVKVAAHRLRQRYRETVRKEIAQTVATEEEVDAELSDLMAALAA